MLHGLIPDPRVFNFNVCPTCIYIEPLESVFDG
jgi:hypothetical protein